MAAERQDFALGRPSSFLHAMNRSEPGVTYSRDKIVGLSFADAIGLICTSVTDASRWAAFEGCIDLSDTHKIWIGSDSIYLERGILVIGAPEPLKTSAELARIEEKLGYAAALRPMFDDLAAGELVVPFWDVDSLKERLLPAHPWQTCWQIVVKNGGAILLLLDNSGQVRREYNLLSLRLAQASALLTATDSGTRDADAAGALQSHAPGALAELRKLGAGDPSKPQRKRGGGRQPKYDWIAAERALAAKIHADGIPREGGGGQASLEKFMQDWFSKHGRFDDAGEREIPSESLIREHVKQVIEVHVKAVHGGR